MRESAPILDVQDIWMDNGLMAHPVPFTGW